MCHEFTGSWGKDITHKLIAIVWMYICFPFFFFVYINIYNVMQNVKDNA